MTPKDYMRRAFAIARKDMGQKGYRPFGAVIVKDGAIICEAVSQSRSSNDPTAHGEVLAIRAACAKLGTRDLSGCELYTTCEPCPLCVSAIWYARIDKTIYAFTLEDCERIGINTQKLIDELALPMAARRHPSKRLLADEAETLFRDWTAAPNFEP
jgi:tRNA(Arg) A34 adenosine deaminase TadA